MALIKCKECGNQVSSVAKTCPGCGAKTPKRHTKAQWLFIGLATVGIVSCIANTQNKEEAAAAVEAKKTPEQRAAESAAKLKKEAEFQRVVAGAKLLKQGAKNPKSFELDSALLMADGTICYQYHATNSFNAVVPGFYALSATKGSDQVSDWNKWCGGKTGTDFTYARRAL